MFVVHTESEHPASDRPPYFAFFSSFSLAAPLRFPYDRLSRKFAIHIQEFIMAQALSFDTRISRILDITSAVQRAIEGRAHWSAKKWSLTYVQDFLICIPYGYANPRAIAWGPFSEFEASAGFTGKRWTAIETYFTRALKLEY